MDNYAFSGDDFLNAPDFSIDGSIHTDALPSDISSPESLQPQRSSLSDIQQSFAPPVANVTPESVSDNAAEGLVRPKGRRVLYTHEQTLELLEAFKKEKFPSQGQCEKLAKSIGKTPRQISIWFQNERHREKFGPERPAGWQHEGRENSPRRKRHYDRLTQTQVQELDTYYTVVKKPDIREREYIASRVGINPAQVYNYFSSKRHYEKKIPENKKQGNKAKPNSQRNGEELPQFKSKRYNEKKLPELENRLAQEKLVNPYLPQTGEEQSQCIPNSYRALPTNSNQVFDTPESGYYTPMSDYVAQQIPSNKYNDEMNPKNAGFAQRSEEHFKVPQTGAGMPRYMYNSYTENYLPTNSNQGWDTQGFRQEYTPWINYGQQVPSNNFNFMDTYLHNAPQQSFEQQRYFGPMNPYPEYSSQPTYWNQSQYPMAPPQVYPPPYSSNYQYQPQSFTQQDFPPSQQAWDPVKGYYSCMPFQDMYAFSKQLCI